MSDDDIIPFANGTDYHDWRERNCARCFKSYDEDARRFCCDLEEALSWAESGDGAIGLEVARRLGHKPGAIIAGVAARCPELARLDQFPAPAAGARR